MKRTLLLTIIAALTLGGWALAREQALLNHEQDIHMQQMDDAPCSSSSTSTGGQ